MEEEQLVLRAGETGHCLVCAVGRWDCMTNRRTSFPTHCFVEGWPGYLHTPLATRSAYRYANRGTVCYAPNVLLIALDNSLVRKIESVSAAVNSFVLP